MSTCHHHQYIFSYFHVKSHRHISCNDRSPEKHKVQLAGVFELSGRHVAGKPHTATYSLNPSMPPMPQSVWAPSVTIVVRRLGEEEQRTFPAKTFPERCYGSDVWYPKCDVLIPHVLPLIPYYSTTSQPLPTPIPNPKREGGSRGSARPSATIASYPRRLRVTVARPSDGPTDPSRRSRRADPALEREAIIIIKGDRRSASAPRVAPPRPISEKQLTTTPLYVGDSYSVAVFVHTATVILWDKVALSAYSESAS